MTRRLRSRHLALALAALAISVRPAAADLVVLRNGQTLEGRVRSKGDQVRIELALGGTVVVAKGDVAKMTVDDKASAATSEAAAVPLELLARLKAREQSHTHIEALAAPKSTDRKKAEQALVATGRGVLPMVRELLAEGKKTERTHALRVLAAIGDPAALPDILGILRNPKDQALHPLAATTLAGIAGHEAVRTLTELLVNSKDDDLRLVCLRELATRRAPFAAPFAVEALRNAALRPTARAAVARWADPVVVPYLLLRLYDGPRDGRVRAATYAAGAMTPAHVVDFTRMLEGAKDNKPLVKALLAGFRRLHTDFPVVGDVALLALPQSKLKTAAFESLKKQFPNKVNDRNANRAHQPQFWKAERDAATRAHVLMVPVGATSWMRVRELASEVARSLKAAGIRVELERKPVQATGTDARRTLAALDLRQLTDHRAVRVVGVTAANVSMPGYDHALAPTRRGGAALVSTAHLGTDRETVLRRARRLVLHALARSLGIPPSNAANCPSGPIYEVTDLDSKAATYSADTQATLTALWEAERAAAAFHYQQAAQRLSRLAREKKSAHLGAQAACMFERALHTTQAINAWRGVQQIDKDPATTALIDKRIELLDRAGKWLVRRGIGPDAKQPKQPKQDRPRKRPPRRNR